MADFQPAYQKLRELEGYFLKDVDGETYAGITKKNYPYWQGWFFIDKYPLLKDGDKIPDDRIEPLIYNFYRTHYWDGKLYQNLASQDLATYLLCQTVNNGYHAIEFLQEALGDIEIDGIFGNKTLEACNKVDGYGLLKIIYPIYASYYTKLAYALPSKREYLHVWLDRIKNVCGVA